MPIRDITVRQEVAFLQCS